jgi:predicted GH43/DUF377 family glycosyl hydrolase
MARIAVALQYYSGDAARALRLACFLASIEPIREDKRVFVLSARWDVARDAATEEALECLRAKFRVVYSQGETRWVGYPGGCNALWRDTIRFVWGMSQRGELAGVDAVLTFEADSVPLWVDWIDRLEQVWEGMPHPKMVAGHRIRSFGVRGKGGFQTAHVNGNMLVSCQPDVLRRIAEAHFSRTYAWDLHMFPVMFERGGAHHIPAILSEFRSSRIAATRIAGLHSAGVVLHHGCKDESLFDALQVRLVPGHRENARAGDCLEAGPDVWRYRDAVPAISSQADVTRVQMSFSDAVVRLVKNPGMAVVPGRGLWCAARVQELSKFRRSCIYTGLLDLASGVLPSPTLEAFPATDSSEHVEDPRVFVVGGVAHVIASFVQYGRLNIERCSQRIFKAEGVGWKRVYDKLPHTRVEKNWVPFLHKDELYCVYQMHPGHVVCNVVTGSRYSGVTSNMMQKWAAKYGEPRGGTPPIEFDGGWLSFFHSHVPDPRYKRRYFMGAYVFRDSSRQTFPVVRMSQRPLLSASAEDGVPMAREGPWKPLVVFPCGAVFDEQTDVWHVLTGVNDFYSVLARFKTDQVFDTF